MDKSSMLRTILGILALSLALAAAPAQAGEDIVGMISRYRQAHGLPAVTADPALMQVARRQADAMATTGVFDHSAAGAFATRIAAANVGAAGENIAMGQTSWAGALSAWISSPGHNRNLLMPGATRVGVAMARGGNNRLYWAMEIGVPEPPRTRTVRRNGKLVRIEAGMPFLMTLPVRRAPAKRPPDDIGHIGEINNGN